MQAFQLKNLIKKLKSKIHKRVVSPIRKSMCLKYKDKKTVMQELVQMTVCISVITYGTRICHKSWAVFLQISTLEFNDSDISWFLWLLTEE